MSHITMSPAGGSTQKGYRINVGAMPDSDEMVIQTRWPQKVPGGRILASAIVWKHSGKPKATAILRLYRSAPADIRSDTETEDWESFISSAPASEP